MSDPTTGTTPTPVPAAPRPGPVPSAPGGEGPDLAVQSALRDLEQAAGGEDAQAQIDAAQRVYDVLQGRLSGVSGR